MEDRACHRGDLSGLRFSTLTLRTPDGHVVQGTILDANGYGLATLVKASELPDLEMRGRVEVILRLTEETLQTSCIVRNHTRKDGLDRYGLEFVSPAEVDAQIGNPRVRQMLCRRSATRIPIPAGEEAPIVLLDEELANEVHGSLVDVSVEGVCVEIASADAERLEGWTNALLDMRLPASDTWLGVPVAVHQRNTTGERSFLSLEFTEDLRDRLRFTYLTISEYVARHSDSTRRAG